MTFLNTNLPTTCPLVTDDVLQAAAWLNDGYLLAYPTESVWGIGCDPFNQNAVQRLLTIKQRPMAKGLIVVTDNITRIEPFLAGLTAAQREQVIDSWQLNSNADPSQTRAKTWLLPIPPNLKPAIPDWVTGTHQSLAIRVINHLKIQKLCAALVSDSNPFGFLISTSCNPTGHSPALCLDDALRYFNSSISAQNVAYFSGDTLNYKLPSQIRDAITGELIR